MPNLSIRARRPSISSHAQEDAEFPKSISRGEPDQLSDANDGGSVAPKPAIDNMASLDDTITLGRRKELLHVPKLLEGLKTWLQSMKDAWTSDVALGETLEKPAEASARLQSGAIVGMFALLAFYFLYFASPILIPIITALLLSMLLAPFVRLLEWLRVPRTLGTLIVVVAAVGGLFGIAASLRGQAQSWLTEPQRSPVLSRSYVP